MYIFVYVCTCVCVCLRRNHRVTKIVKNSNADLVFIQDPKFAIIWPVQIRLFQAPTHTMSSGFLMLMSEAIRDVDQTMYRGRFKIFKSKSS